ncbi:hypothetical protein EW145_g5145 [Phellinidium pouzarii]|uniref:Protein kinase domain-containing protein n=1 Tax=Phellinidium pouzarii TaxID=167371 RepID=A0A4S4L174_9AGAM|nr:hypothetical protein EW145_g5145 [Phellinidium pouzarii]
MAITTQLGPPRLSLDEKDMVAKTLRPYSKVYAAALVVLWDEALSETGALALVRSNEDYCLLLVNFSGQVIWSYVLSMEATLGQSPYTTQHYLLRNRDPSVVVNIAFADGVEASKMCSKFNRVSKRHVGEKESAESLDSSFSSVLDRLHIGEDLKNKDALHERKPTPTPGRASSDSNLKSVEVTNTKEHMRRTSSVPSSLTHAPRLRILTTSSKALDGPSTYPSSGSFVGSPMMIEQFKKAAVRSSSSLEQSSTGVTIKTCTVKVRDKSYEVPDVTSELVHISHTREEGGFGVVRLGRFRDNSTVAVKRVKRSGCLTFSEPTAMRYSKVSGTNTLRGAFLVYLVLLPPFYRLYDEKRFESEAFMGMLCNNFRHPNIQKFHGIAVSDRLGACLVFPWMQNGDSLAYVREHKDVPRMPIILGAFNGISFLHESGIVHGDIKGKNILITDEGEPVVCDFGLTSMVDEQERQEMSRSLQYAGNANWKAYELFWEFFPGSKATRESDVWACGMFIIEMLSGDIPFPGQSSQNIFLSLVNYKFPARPVSDDCSDELWSLIQQCWRRKPDERPTASHVLSVLRPLTSSRLQHGSST